MRILLTDDDARFAGVLSASLGALGHEVTVVSPATAMGTLAAGARYELAVVDADGASGRRFLDEYRRVAPDLKVIVLTSAATLETSVEFLRGGAAAKAVDYIEKPVVDLARRIDEAAYRHVSIIERGPFVADLPTHCGYYDGHSIDLTEHEFDVFVVFMRRPYDELSYETLSTAIWGRETNHDDSYTALRSVISRLRRKLREAAGREVLSRHIEGRGIRFMPGGTGPRVRHTSKPRRAHAAAG